MRFSTLLLCIIISVSVVYGDNRESKLVKTTQGDVRGYKEHGTNVFAFYGIPYATAPTDHFRFKAPIPPPAWMQPLEATDQSIICPQPRIQSLPLFNRKMQDDCLIVNVYVPDTAEKRLPVVVFIHGGSFQVGYGDMARPTMFVSEKNIIGVTFNYRLGVNGFLCLGTPGASGNAGLKDQVALLRWVKRNIGNFGGNPDDVTIAGCNSGSISAELLMLSKSTKDLFHKVIPASGCSVGFSALQSNPIETAKVFARSLNFTDGDVFALEEFYKRIPIELLTSESFLDRVNFVNSFTPCVERYTKDDYVFLDEAPVNILKQKKYRKLPMLYGYDDIEGLLQTWNFDNFGDRMNKNFSEFLPVDLQFESKEEREQATRKVKEFYFGNKPINKNIISKIIDYFGDILISYPSLRSVKLHVEAEHDQIYLYKHSLKEEFPDLSLADTLNGMKCSQIMGVLNGEPDNNRVNKEYESVKKTMTELWYNFIKTSKPVPEDSSLPSWAPAGLDASPYMSLGRSNVELKQGLLNDRVQFWDELYEKHYRPPIPPPQPPIRHTEL